MAKEDEILQLLGSMNTELKRVTDRLTAVEARMGTVEAEVKRVASIQDEQVLPKLAAMETRMDTMETHMEAMETRMDTMETHMEAMETRMDTMETHMEAMETRMDTMETRMGTMEADLKRVSVTQEQRVLRGIELLAEGHENILEHVASHEELEAVQEDLDVFKAAVKAAIKL